MPPAVPPPLGQWWQVAGHVAALFTVIWLPAARDPEAWCGPRGRRAEGLCRGRRYDAAVSAGGLANADRPGLTVAGLARGRARAAGAGRGPGHARGRRLPAHLRRQQ